jgi:hypothetical protein
VVLCSSFKDEGEGPKVAWAPGAGRPASVGPGLYGGRHGGGVVRCVGQARLSSGAVARDHITKTDAAMTITDQTGAYGRNMKYAMA